MLNSKNNIQYGNPKKLKYWKQELEKLAVLSFLFLSYVKWHRCKMKIYNLIDEQKRFAGFKATTEIGEQEDDCVISYLGIRKILEKFGGQLMGLDILLEGEWELWNN